MAGPWKDARGVIVTNTPGVLDDEVADVAMALTLMTVRELPQAERFLRAGEWMKRSYPLTASLRGRTMGILGLGRIGTATAMRAKAIGLKGVIYFTKQHTHLSAPPGACGAGFRINNDIIRQNKTFPQSRFKP